MATHSSILAWKISWAEESGRLRFMGSQRDMAECLSISGLLGCHHFLFILFLYILFCNSDFHHSVLQVIYPFFCLSYSAIASFQCIILFICLFFLISCRYLVNISCLFSIFASILFPRSWIIFTIIMLRFFSLEDCLSPIHLVVFLGFYLVPSSGT